ncbi:MAG: aldehyde dehydrogenase family protein [Pirellulales bacterium]|nr:aldehyde dehydrogenase family protein [Pirellulales bacterium]
MNSIVHNAGTLHPATNPADRELIDFPSRLWINGRWVDAESGKTFAVENPANGQIVGNAPFAAAPETTAAVEAAVEAMNGWRRKSPIERAGYLTRIHDLLMEYRESLALLRMREQGGTLEGCRAAVDYAAGFFKWFAEEAPRIYGRTIPHPDPARRVRIEYYPIGVVGALGPWNGPLSSVSKKLAAALAAGCTFVFKPATLTPLSAFALAWITDQAGLPPGVFNVVSGDTKAIGQVLLNHEKVRLIAMTGSTEVGQYVAHEAGKQIKRLALELGGNAPFIICADADLDQAAEDLVWLKTIYSGQVCVTANRLLVERSIYEPFVERICTLLAKHKVGMPDDPQTTIGPMICPDEVTRIKNLVDESLAAGAIIRFQLPMPVDIPADRFYPPTILDNVRPNMRICNEEIFGPVLPVLPFDNDAEVIRHECDENTTYGLAAYVYTQSMSRAQLYADELDVGILGINDPRPITPATPFGGTKLSGIGREGGSEGIMEYLEARLIGMRF